MNYARFKTEDELLKSVLSVLSVLFYEAYPKVSAIGGKKIVPDIDILGIRKISDYQFQLIGYEVKLMKFDKRNKGLSWTTFYSGIGQTLLSLKNGVHRTVLVLGFHESVEKDKLINDFSNWIRDNKDLLNRIFGSYLSIGVHLYERTPITLLVEASADFYAPDEKIQLLSDELLHRKFTFNKKLKRD